MEENSLAELQKAISIIRSESVNGRGAQEQKWLQSHLEKPKLRSAVTQLSIVSLHILSGLQEHELTGIELAEQLNVTRGGITRAAKKLAEAGLIKISRKPDDKKKIYYSLTEDGAKIASVHDEMHRTLNKRMTQKIISKYSDSELKNATKLISDLAEFEREFY
ncbi:MarR family winged helix-turn-helix transcriptional regulator [Lentilactobacillus sp. SPB1-3]|uniref:MarR family winged helix-turn-helix transcriptional regulator n=1 Tax=Lentilactobacillus terminaliae TaxID=3003483 RepID=A0ACD5DDH1_9LACO|nr:MarR family transcriptional regulator [Lentilactobacillus sp. SPB1-3]MCZ0977738.1 MarR family transcriptional regulator [Lentilactobacillus sp. SPB1-3]